MNDRSLNRFAEPDAPAREGSGRVVAWLVDLSPGWADLAAEWLAEAGYAVRRWAGSAPQPADPAAPAVVLLGLAFPRRDGAQQVRSVRSRWPGAPLLLLSPTFHAGVACDGSLSRALGADGVVALPAARDALLGAVQRVLATPA